MFKSGFKEKMNMKIKGINPFYSVEIEKGTYVKEKGVCITLTDASGMQIAVAISDKDWDKIKQI